MQYTIEEINRSRQRTPGGIQKRKRPVRGDSRPQERAGQTAGSKYRILIVDTNPEKICTTDTSLNNDTTEACLALSEQEAKHILAHRTFHLVMIAMDTPEINGLTLLQHITAGSPGTPAVMMSAGETGSRVIEAMRCGAVDFMVKPFTAGELQAALERVDKHHKKNAPAEERISILIKQMSHDIRGGLLNMAALTRLLQGRRSTQGDKTARQLETLYANANQLAGIAEDYCSLAYSVNQGEALPGEYLDPRRDIIPSVLEEFTFEAGRRGITIADGSGGGEQGSVTVKGNRLLLGSVFRTIFSNAVNHCRKDGRITYELSHYNNMFHFSITNEGAPIDRNMTETVFREFFSGSRTSSTANAKETGRNSLGIGLSLARHIVLEYGGSISCVPQADGTCFFVSLPAGDRWHFRDDGPGGAITADERR